MAARIPKLTQQAALDVVRGLMRGSSFDEDEQIDNRILFSSREGGDMEKDRADPGLLRFAVAKAKEIEEALPGSKARVEAVDEWVTLGVTLSSKASSPKVVRVTEIPAKVPLASPPVPTDPQKRCVPPGTEVDYTNFTVGGSFKGKAIVTWDHGKSVEARTLSGEPLRLKKASDGSLRRFT
jgi:hypothetical protein